MGHLGIDRRFPARCALSDHCSAATFRWHGRTGNRADFVGADRRPLWLDDWRGDLGAVDGRHDPACGRPPAANDQAFPDDRARQGKIGGRFCGIEPHARPGLPGTRTARHGLRQVPQMPDGRRANGEYLQPGAGFRAQTAIQQSGSRFPLHGRLQPEVPRSGTTSAPCEGHVGNGDARRRQFKRQCQRHDAGQWPSRKADARALSARKRARQGRHGRGLPWARSENQPRRSDQDHGLVTRV